MPTVQAIIDEASIEASVTGYAEIAKQAFIKATLNIPYKITSLEFITLYEYANGYIKTIGNITGIINYFKNK